MRIQQRTIERKKLVVQSPNIKLLASDEAHDKENKPTSDSSALVKKIGSSYSLDDKGFDAAWKLMLSTMSSSKDTPPIMKVVSELCKDFHKTIEKSVKTDGSEIKLDMDQIKDEIKQAKDDVEHFKLELEKLISSNTSQCDKKVRDLMTTMSKSLIDSIPQIDFEDTDLNAENIMEYICMAKALKDLTKGSLTNEAQDLSKKLSRTSGSTKKGTSNQKKVNSLESTKDVCILCEYYDVFGKRPTNLIKAYDKRIEEEKTETTSLGTKS